jgi:hypothetical protein
MNLTGVLPFETGFGGWVNTDRTSEAAAEPSRWIEPHEVPAMAHSKNQIVSSRRQDIVPRTTSQAESVIIR